VGGTCLNHGCIPSKAYIAATDRVDDVVDATGMGIYADPYVDPVELTEWKDGVVERLTDGVEGLCRAAGVTVVDGRVTFRNEASATVDTGENEYAVGFENAVVATGSRPIELDGFSFEDDPVLDSRSALDLTNVPDDLVVVGAGYIGMELATVFRKLGGHVTIVEMEDRVLPAYEADLAALVQDRAEELGIEFEFGHVATEWTETSGGIRVTTRDEDDAGTTHDAEAVLVAVGREPVTAELGLDTLGVDTTDRGFVVTDDRGRTDCESVFAIGDVAGEPMLAHEAMMAGGVVADVLAGREATMADRPIPAAVFTDPEVATVGLTED
jgi:dihydrolipoamide dehydrogenase